MQGTNRSLDANTQRHCAARRAGEPMPRGAMALRGSTSTSDRTMRLLMVLAALILVAPVFAEERLCSPAWVHNLSRCDDIARCAGEARLESDHELNRAFNELRTDLVEPRLLVQAQRAWLRYRKAECEYQSSGYDCESGTTSMCSVERAMCEVHVTCERVRRLQEHLQQKCNGCPLRKSGAVQPGGLIDTDVLSAGSARLLSTGHLHRQDSEPPRCARSRLQGH